MRAEKRTGQPSARVRRAGRAGDRRRSAGLIVILLLVMIVVGGMYAIALGLNTASAALKLGRDQSTSDVLKRAKEELIAWAATRAADGPGHLPCPDRKTIDSAFAGNQESTCVGAAARIGRLPFRTIGMPELRDASGERLWYALSPTFRDGATIPVNSDTQGALTVEGRSTASNVVAIIFAPGAVLGGQVRDAAVSNLPANYLEAPNPYVADSFLAWTGCEASACPLPFNGGSPVTMAYNDRFIVITHEDLFRVVEAVVQRRIEQEIATRLTNPSGTGPGYFELWGTDLYGDARRGFFPSAAPYDDPGRALSNYRGVFTANPAPPPALVPQIAGLLPLSTDPTWVRWSNIAVVKTNPLSTGTLDSMPPAACGPDCDFMYTCAGTCNFVDNGLNITFSARLRNAANSFVLPTGITGAGDWVLPLQPAALVSVTPRLFDMATGDLLITLNIRLPPTAVSTLARVTLPNRQFSPLTFPAGWFVANQWYRQTYYSISDGFRLRSDLGTRVIDPLNAAYATTPPCLPDPAAPACIAVDNGPAKARAVLVLAGRNLAGGTRAYAVANYFEGKNADVPPTNGPPPNQVFERQLRTSNFNDRVVVVAPEPVLP